MIAGGQFPGMGPGPATGSINDDAITQLKAIVLNLANLVTAFAGLQDAAGTVGSFTFPAAASVVVPNVNIEAGSLVFLQAQNASAGTLVGSNESPYIAPADYVVGVSFTVRTAAGTAAAGTEVFSYRIVNVS
jgi:hypothetical protein